MNHEYVFVICSNDFPSQVLPRGTTEEDAEAICRFLNAPEKEREKNWKPNNPPRIFYHHKQVPITAEPQPIKRQ